MRFKRFSFFDGEGTGNEGAGDPPKTYTQEEFNAAIENERKRESEKLRTLTVQLEDLKSKTGDKAAYEQQIRELQESLMTKEELAKKKLKEKEEESKNQLESVTKSRDEWQSRFQNTLIQREILDAAQKEGAYDSNIFINLLKDNTTTTEVLDEDGKGTGFFKVVVKLNTTDSKDGKNKVLSLNPEEAIKYLKGQPEKYGYLFKGLGTPGTGLTSGNKTFTEKDLESMSPEEYAKHRDQLLKKK